MHYGEILQELRRDKKLTQKQVGELLSVSGSSIGFYESGEREPSPEMLSSLATLYGVSVDYILGRTRIRESNITSASLVKTDKEVVKIGEILNDIVSLSLEGRGIVINVIKGQKAIEQRKDSST